jgi:peptidyl-prolyl cis-trans isomerase B (cyclophilin B)
MTKNTIFILVAIVIVATGIFMVSRSYRGASLPAAADSDEKINAVFASVNKAINQNMESNTSTSTTSSAPSSVAGEGLKVLQPAADGSVRVPKYTTAKITTSKGVIEVALHSEQAPLTVANFGLLAGQGFYNGTAFHRVIKGFMIQAGDPLSKDPSQKDHWGMGGPSYKFPDEINSLPMKRGALAMANAGPNTNGSQFFIITAAETPWLNGKHTVFGEVTKGMDIVDAIESAKTEGPDRPVETISIMGIEVK